MVVRTVTGYLRTRTRLPELHQGNLDGDARGRFGYAVNNLLFYATGGYAAAGVDVGVKSAVTNALLASASSTRSGWTAGGGIEWGFAPNWSVKFELLYVKFNNAAFITVQAEGPRTVPLDDTIVRFRHQLSLRRPRRREILTCPEPEPRL